jgi:hypothetical protein
LINGRGSPTLYTQRRDAVCSLALADSQVRDCGRVLMVIGANRRRPRACFGEGKHEIAGVKASNRWSRSFAWLGIRGEGRLRWSGVCETAIARLVLRERGRLGRRS